MRFTRFIQGYDARPATLALLAIALSRPAAAGFDLSWSARFTSGPAVDQALSAVTDAGGNVYVTGTSGTGDAADILTLKYAPDGTQMWVATHDGPANGQDLGAAIALSPEGNVVIAGRSSVTSSDIVVIKYDAATGAPLWTTYHDSGGIDEPNALVIDASGNVVIAGLAWNEDQSDFSTVMLDSAGQVQWTDVYDGPGPFLFAYDTAEAVAIDAAGDVFVTGPSNSTAGSEDYVTIKYRGTDGTRLWLERYDGGSNDVATDIALSPEGDVYVTGLSYQPASTYTTLRYDGDSGSLLWSAIANPGWHDRPAAITLDAQGDVYVVGISDPDGDESNLNYNAAVVKHRALDGAMQWMTIYGENGFNDYETANDIAIDAAGNVIVTGETSSFGANNDLLMLNLDPATGQILDTTVFDSGSTESTAGLEIAIDPDQNIVVAGMTRDFNTEDRDFLTLKYEAMAPGPVPADLDGDGTVGVSDLLELLASWGDCAACPADLDGDGGVGVGDLLELLAAWG